MNDNQYRNAYSVDDSSKIAFSTLYSKENIDHLNEIVEISLTDSSTNIHIIIDNRDTPITPNDATPTGIITIYLDVKVTATYESFID
jgi:hypothetical protein